jgi:acetylornithine deacetylase/succinyl-diaminopimelate desuccinylase-like protein
MPELSLADLIAAVDPERAVRFASTIAAVELVAGVEGPRAEAVADLVAHPRLQIHVDPVLPNRPNVIVRLPGTGDGPGLLLNGHLDANFVKNGWTHSPLAPWVSDGRLYGGGITDMLAGVASMMETMRAAADLAPFPGDLVLLANMHHDSNGLGTKYALATGDEWPAYAINGEPTSLSIMSRHGGCVKFELRFHGRTAHVSRSEEGADALAAAAAAYAALAARPTPIAGTSDSGLPGLPHLLVGIMNSGIAPGEVPETAILRGDLRTVPGMTWSSISSDLENVVASAVVPGVTGSVHCLVRQRPYTGKTSGPLFQALSDAHMAIRNEVVGVNVDAGTQHFVTDATDLQAAGIESLVYGPSSWHLGPDESVDITEMADAARVYLATARRLSQAIHA